MVQLCRIIAREIRGCMFTLRKLSDVQPHTCPVVRYRKPYMNSWGIHFPVRLFSRRMKNPFTEKWEVYSNRVFTKFLDKLDENDLDVEKEFVKLEEAFDQFEAVKSTTSFQIINLLIRCEKQHLVLDYIDFLRRKGDILPFSLLRAIDGVTPLYPEIGLSWINEFLQKIPWEHQMRPIRHRVISGLLHTKDYKVAVELLQKEIVKPLDDSFYESGQVALLCRALHSAVLHQDIDLFSFLTEKYHMYFLKIPYAFFDSSLEYLRSGVMPPDVFLEVLKHFFMGPSLLQLKLMETEFDKYWGDSVSMEYVQLSKESHRCPACGGELRRTQFRTESIENLAEGVAQRMVAFNTGKNLWKTEMDLDSLEMCLQNVGPFDVVVDTLNTTSGRKQQINDLMENIRDLMVQNLRKPNPKILFITKVRPEPSKRDYPAGCFVFVSNQRGDNDDLLVMLATLKSGPDAYFISNDLFVDHLRDAGPELYKALLQWKRARNISFKKRKRDDIWITVSMPFPFEIVPQETDQAWHVPYSIPSGLSGYQALYSNPVGDQFLCIQKMAKWQPSALYTKMFMDKQSKYRLKNFT